MCTETKKALPVLKVGDKVKSQNHGEGEVICVLQKPTTYGNEVIIQITSGDILIRRKNGQSSFIYDSRDAFVKIPKKKTLYCFTAKSNWSGKYYIESSSSGPERREKIKKWSREGRFVILDQHEREIEVED